LERYYLSVLRRLSCLLLTLVLLVGLAPLAWAEQSGEVRETTVLFTHDLHSHFLPQAQGDGTESGGYARLKTALDRERAIHPDALTLDGGDFSIGSLIQTLYTAQAAELRTMGALGYDATTAGNHEFDHTGNGFAQMLRSAAMSGDRTPALLMANYKPAQDNPDRLDIQRAMASYGVQDYMLLERGGITYGIFGLMGEDSDDCAPTSGFTLGDMVSNAQRCVDALKEQGAQFIIALSHSGTNEVRKLSEDERLAEKVTGIDLVISGHTHTTLEEPLVVGDTYIVSSGPYCQNLGSITIQWSEDGGDKVVTDYRLIPIDETIPEDPDISALVDNWKTQVGSSYLARYGLTYDQVLTTSGFDLRTPASGVQTGNALGELVADAFHWAASTLAADQTDVPTVAVTADGVLRADLYAGEITASQAFDVLSMGVGSDGTSGFPLVAVYLTGKELKAAAEVDASVTPLMPAAQLYLSGMEYAFNTRRMFFNRVTESHLTVPAYQTDATGEDLGDIVDDQLYRVVTGMYSAQMLGTVKSKSMGLLALEPKMADGSPVTNFEDCILYDKNGSELKEWYALAAYLTTFGQDGVPEHYAAADGRKQVSHSLAPLEMVKNLNWITAVVLALLVMAVLLVVLAVRCIVVRKRGRRYRGGRRR
jgi:2',3'-cyclic-nucleotide 2'-phosphodiesterase (5'-nucleotidase family)